MREGVDREGRHLYPAFPYDHFTRVTDEDNRALYAYLMTREPVSATAPANELPFPLNIRSLLAGWKLLFFDEGAFQAGRRAERGMEPRRLSRRGPRPLRRAATRRATRSAPRSTDRHFAGGEAEGWQAYAIDGSPAPVPWDRESLAFYSATAGTRSTASRAARWRR